MKVLLLHRDRDFDARQALPWNAAALTQDLDLETLVGAMGRDDEFLLNMARKVLLNGFGNDLDTVLYRQEILKDCLENSEIVVELYGLAVEAIERARGNNWGITSHYPSSMLYAASEMLGIFVDMLRRLRETAERNEGRFRSEGFRTFFSRACRELSDEYLASVEEHLAVSRFEKGLFLSASLGSSNESADFVLRKLPKQKLNWFERLFYKGPPKYSFRLHERDEAGARIVSNIRYRGISRVAVALAESADHVLGFFKMLQTELAFYIGCTNLHASLVSSRRLVSFPMPRPSGERVQEFRELYDPCLSLRTQSQVVGNAADASDKGLVVITGANQGGKSSFLRSIGLAQIMMQCGMFVGAETFEAELCPALFTHYKREEDARMESGKFDEELARMSEIADHIGPNSMILFNESFAATNDREGSEIAKQIVSAMLEKGVKVFYVTHLYQFAHSFFDERGSHALFLRAERQADGTRTFKLKEGEPLETSYGEDLYRGIFESNSCVLPR